MYRNVLTEMSPDQNGQIKMVQTEQSCSMWPHSCYDW